MESDKTPSGDGMRSELLSASGWKDYELLDSGRFEKLERFGCYVLARPEPQGPFGPLAQRGRVEGSGRRRVPS